MIPRFVTAKQVSLVSLYREPRRNCRGERFSLDPTEHVSVSGTALGLVLGFGLGLGLGLVLGLGLRLGQGLDLGFGLRLELGLGLVSGFSLGLWLVLVLGFWLGLGLVVVKFPLGDAR